MSQLENLKEQLKSSVSKVGQRIQESPAYQQAQDRYESLSPSGQKLALVLGSLLLVFVLLYYPLTQFTTTQETLTSFQEKRDLIRELFRTYRDASSTPNIAIPPPPDALRMSIDSVISRAELLPEQKLGITPAAPEGRLIPNNLVSATFDVKLAKLNLKQITDIGASLVAISQSVKMKDLIITANSQDTRYYDVTYKLYSLNVPRPSLDEPAEPAPNTGGNRRNQGNDR